MCITRLKVTGNRIESAILEYSVWLQVDNIYIETSFLALISNSITKDRICSTYLIQNLEETSIFVQ